MNSIYKIVIIFVIFIISCGSNEGNMQKLENGLLIEDIVVGVGNEAKDHNKVVVNYTGTLENGSIFDSSLKPGRDPFTFIHAWSGFCNKGLGSRC